MSPRKQQDTTTIQVFPGGACYTFRGNPDGPANQKSLRPAYRSSDKPNPWRKGTAEEWRAIRIQQRAEMYGERDILCCDSALVDDLLKGGCTGDVGRGFEYDEIRNLYQDPSDWDVERCQKYADDYGVELDPLPRLGDSPQLDETAVEDDWLPAARDKCREHSQDNPAEVYEWWRVTGWLCDQLHSIGEVTIDNGYGRWWGRCCTGQAWIMDGTLQQIAAQFERMPDA